MSNDRSGQLDFFLVQINPVCLRVLNQIANALGIGFPVAVAFERIGSAAGFDEDVRPNQPGVNVNGRDFGNADADFIPVNPRALAADDGKRRDLDHSGKKEISACPAAGFKNFLGHDETVVQEVRLSNLILAAGPPVSSVSGIILLHANKMLVPQRRLDRRAQTVGLDLVDAAFVLQGGLFWALGFCSQFQILFCQCI